MGDECWNFLLEMINDFNMYKERLVDAAVKMESVR